MKRAILLYNAKAGKGKIEKNIRDIIDIFREADYDMQPLSIGFETNPLEALELVSNRRKLTKKQLDEIIDKLSK